MIENIFTADDAEIKKLSPELIDFLKEQPTLDKLKKISVDFKLDEKSEKQFKNIFLNVVKGKIELYSTASVIKDVMEFEFNKAMELDDRIYKDLFSDLEDELEMQYETYQSLNPEESPVLREEKEENIKEIEKEKEEFTPLVDKAVKKFELSFDENLKTRFYDICGTFLNSARTKSQLKNTLMKPVKSGGLGFDGKTAEGIASFLGSYLRIKELEKKKEKVEDIAETQKIESLKTKDLEKEESLSISSPPLASSPEAPARREKGDTGGFINPPQPSFSKGGGDEVGFASEEKEAESLKQKVEEFKSGASQATSAEEKVDKALDEISVSFPSSELQERLKKAVEARIRNVRTATQTFEKLTMDTEKGGLGLSKEEADKISLILNKYLEGGDKELYQSKVKEVKAFEAKVKAQSQEKKQREKEREGKTLEEKFQKLTAGRKVKKTRKQEKQIPAPLEPSSTPLPPPKKVEKTLPTPSSPPLASSPEAPARREKGDTGGFINPPQPSFFKGGGIPSKRPIVEDIKYTPKLYGPVQEI
ncbi:hypothetical protein KJ885_05875, partial [Patescibacteria group bacterium]|nr:hypothetical protein [Patescibacteria group bacterium]